MTSKLKKKAAKWELIQDPITRAVAQSFQQQIKDLQDLVTRRRPVVVDLEPQNTAITSITATTITGMEVTIDTFGGPVLIAMRQHAPYSGAVVNPGTKLYDTGGTTSALGVIYLMRDDTQINYETWQVSMTAAVGPNLQFGTFRVLFIDEPEAGRHKYWLRASVGPTNRLDMNGVQLVAKELF